MALVKFLRGKKSLYKYNITSEPHVLDDQDKLYFATDTKELLLNGVSYGVSTEELSELKSAFKSAEINPATNAIKFTKMDGSEVSINIPEATVSLAGLLSASDKNKLDSITKSTAETTTEINEAVGSAVKKLKAGVSSEYDNLEKLEGFIKINAAAIEALGGGETGSIKAQIDQAINDLKNGATAGYDTLKGLEDKIKAEVTRATQAEGTKSGENSTVATDLWGAIEEVLAGYKAADATLTGEVNGIKANLGTKSDSSSIVATDVWSAIDEVSSKSGSDLSGLSGKVDKIREELGEKDSPAEGTIHKDIDDIQAKLPLKADLEGGKIPASQLPSYVDDVIEGTMSGENEFTPAQGQSGAAKETGKIYVDTASGKTYRWSGTVYVEISASLVVGEGAGQAFDGARGKALETWKTSTVDPHIANKENPHKVTKDQVGLGNVDNTSDLNKPISTATQAALEGKLDVTKYNSDKSAQDKKIQDIETEIGDPKDESNPATGIYKYIDDKVGAEHGDLTSLTQRVESAETKLTTIQGDENTVGSINKALKDSKDYTNLLLEWEDVTE